MTRRESILRVLESGAALCLDVAEERDVIAAAIEAALASDSDAQLVRAAFRRCSPRSGHIEAMRAMGGAREAEVLEAAHRLARG